MEEPKIETVAAAESESWTEPDPAWFQRSASQEPASQIETHTAVPEEMRAEATAVPTAPGTMEQKEPSAPISSAAVPSFPAETSRQNRISVEVAFEASGMEVEETSELEPIEEEEEDENWSALAEVLREAQARFLASQQAQPAAHPVSWPPGAAAEPCVGIPWRNWSAS